MQLLNLNINNEYIGDLKVIAHRLKSPTNCVKPSEVEMAPLCERAGQITAEFLLSRPPSPSSSPLIALSLTPCNNQHLAFAQAVGTGRLR